MQLVHDCVSRAARHDQIGGVSARPGHPAHETAAVQCGRVVALGDREAGGREHLRRLQADHAQYRPLGGHVDRLDPLQEAHLLQVVQHGRSGTGLGVDPHRPVEFDELPVLLDVSVRGQHQGLAGVAVGQLGQVLRADRVQPAQPLGPGDLQHVTVGAVDHADAGGQQALFT